jgi:hypothetical protein
MKANSGSAFLVSRSLILLLTFIIINALLVVDTSIVRISSFTGGMYPFENYMILFVLIYAAYAIGTVIIIRLVNSQIHSGLGAKSLLFKSFFAGITATQYAILFMIFILIFQILTNKFYSVWILKCISFNSYLMGGIMLSLLSYKLLSWYKNKKSVILILYFFAMALICANSILMIYSLQIQLDSKPDNISYTRSLTGGFAPGSGVFKLIQDYLLIISFSLMWLATALLMKNYSSRKGMVRYWGIMIISLIYFTGQFQPIFGIINLSAISTTLGDIGYTIFVSAAKPIAGILFGLVFWSISRKMTNTVIKQYLLIAGFGVMMLFASNQSAGLSLTPLPPFGIITAAFFGVSTYLLFVGLYSSAVSVSHDLTIRKQAKIYAKQLMLLDWIGTPQMKQHVESIVSGVMKDLKKKVYNLVESSGVLPSMDEENFKDYLETVLKEILVESSGVLPPIDEENFKDYLETVLKEIKKSK